MFFKIFVVSSKKSVALKLLLLLLLLFYIKPKSTKQPETSEANEKTTTETDQFWLDERGAKLPLSEADDKKMLAILVSN